MDQFPLYIQSKTDIDTCFVFRSDGREVQVSLKGHEPVSSIKLYPEERMHIIENYMSKEITLNSSING